LFGSLGAFALLVAVFVLPEELYGYKTHHLFGMIVVAIFFLAVAVLCLWLFVRSFFGKKRDK
jgi:ribose/xylose/arabinose/galactoside ABC-type transport system permease subunit